FLSADEHLTRPGHVVQLAARRAVWPEQHHPAVLAVGDIDGAVRVNGNAVRDVELPYPTTRLAPRVEQFAVGRETVDAFVAVAVGDVEVTVRGDGEVGGVVERPGGAADGAVIDARRPGVGGLARRAEREAELALGAEGEDGVAEIVSAVDRVVGADG